MKSHASNPRDQREARARHARMDREERQAIKRQRAKGGEGMNGSTPDVDPLGMIGRHDDTDTGGEGGGAIHIDRVAPYSPPNVTPRPTDLPDEYTEQMVYAVMRERDRIAALPVARCASCRVAITYHADDPVMHIGCMIAEDSA